MRLLIKGREDQETHLWFAWHPIWIPARRTLVWYEDVWRTPTNPVRINAKSWTYEFYENVKQPATKPA